MNTINNFRVGDVVMLQDPIPFGELDANGQPISGLSYETQVVVILRIESGVVLLAPATNVDPALLNGASQLFPTTT